MNPAADHSASSSFSRRVWFLGIFVIAPLLMLIAGAGVLALRYRSLALAAHDGIEAEAERLRAGGEPLTPADLHA